MLKIDLTFHPDSSQLPLQLLPPCIPTLVGPQILHQHCQLGCVSDLPSHLCVAAAAAAAVTDGGAAVTDAANSTPSPTGELAPAAAAVLTVAVDVFVPAVCDTAQPASGMP